VLEHAVVSRVSESVLFGGDTSIELPGFVDLADSGDSFGSKVPPLTHGHIAVPNNGTVAIRIAFGYTSGTGLMDSSIDEQSNIVAGTIGVDDAQGVLSSPPDEQGNGVLPARKSLTNFAFAHHSLLASIKSDNTCTCSSD